MRRRSRDASAHADLIAEDGNVHDTAVAECRLYLRFLSETVKSGNETSKRDVDRDFAEALTLIAAIPLSDDEKAEAVRPLLASLSVTLTTVNQNACTSGI